MAKKILITSNDNNDTRSRAHILRVTESSSNAWKDWNGLSDWRKSRRHNGGTILHLICRHFS
jgi:hypothetical protein